MRVAVTGKGGSGKTALVAMLARVLAGRGWRVLAVDLDANPGLAVSLGLTPADVVLPDEALAPGPGGGLAEDVAPAEAVRRYGIPAGGGIVFFGLGNLVDPSRGLRRYSTAARQLTEGFAEPGWAVVADVEAGPTRVFSRLAGFAELTLVVAEAAPASLLVAEGLLGILDHDEAPAAVVVGKARGPADASDVEAALGPPLAVIPFDVQVRREERVGSLAGLPADSPALAAVAALGGTLEERLDGRGHA